MWNLVITFTELWSYCLPLLRFRSSFPISKIRVFSSNLKMEAACSYEVLLPFCQIRERHIPQNRNLDNRSGRNIKSQKFCRTATGPLQVQMVQANEQTKNTGRALVAVNFIVTLFCLSLHLHPLNFVTSS
jgi:hypothetical protein